MNNATRDKSQSFARSAELLTDQYVERSERSPYRKISGPTLVLASMIALAVAGCHAEPPAKPAAAVPEVFFIHPVASYVTPFEEFSGRLWSPNVVTLRARVGGYLEKVGFKDGADVKEGQILYEIDDDTYQATVGQAQAMVEQAKARHSRLVLQLNRAETLLPKKAISQDEFETIKFDATEAAAAESSAEAALKLAELNLAFTKVTAPISGRVGRTLIDAGNLVEEDATDLATIVSLDPLYAYFEFDERTILKMRELVVAGKMKTVPDYERPVQIALAGQDGFTFSGNFNWIDNQIDPATGTLRARIEIKNPDLLLSPGMFVRLRVPVGPAEQLPLIPEECLGSDQGLRFVYVINADDVIEYRRVEIGWLEGTSRVIHSGLSVDDRVVATGLQRVRPKDKVTATDRDKLERSDKTTEQTPAVWQGSPQRQQGRERPGKSTGMNDRVTRKATRCRRTS